MNISEIFGVIFGCLILIFLFLLGLFAILYQFALEKNQKIFINSLSKEQRSIIAQYEHLHPSLRQVFRLEKDFTKVKYKRSRTGMKYYDEVVK